MSRSSRADDALFSVSLAGLCQPLPQAIAGWAGAGRAGGLAQRPPRLPKAAELAPPASRYFVAFRFLFGLLPIQGSLPFGTGRLFRRSPASREPSMKALA